MSDILFIALDDQDSETPLYRQIYGAIRQAILSGRYEAKRRLPASRRLAAQLGVSRMTVINAYEQLYAEGYLEGRAGSGTFVAAALPEDFLQTPKIENRKEMPAPARPARLSVYGRQLAKSDYAVLRNQSPSEFLPFQHGIPAFEEFPFETWSKIAQKWQSRPAPALLGYGEPAGYRPLREAVAAHLEAARGVKCTAEQVVITGGTQQAIDLIARVLLDPGDTVWMEEPGYAGARDIFASMGARIAHVAVDREGFNVERARATGPAARLAYVTPSHQFPLGMTMSLARRLKLLEWAGETGGWILEDDYNSEYRYAGRPLASLQGLDPGGRVIYVGTFSKTVFPALRLGCLVLPPELAEVFAAGRALTDVHSPTVNQAMLAEFISEGHFARHLRRMRNLYEERQDILIGEVKKHLGDFLRVEKAESGMHLVGWLPPGVDDREIAR